MFQIFDNIELSEPLDLAFVVIQVFAGLSLTIPSFEHSQIFLTNFLTPCFVNVINLTPEQQKDNSQDF